MGNKLSYKKVSVHEKVSLGSAIKASLKVALLASVSMDGVAGVSERYTNGIEGIKAASVPGPGDYYRMYNVYYTADEIIDFNGSNSDLDVDLTVLANVHRYIKVTETKILGADYFWDVVVPIIHTDIEINAAGVDEASTELGDIVIEPFGLSWHGSQWDAAFALTFFLPTGDYDIDDPSKPGRDYFTSMVTLGGTAYFDDAKRYSLSLLGRYETHEEHDTLDLTAGDDFHFEWGFGAVLNDKWEVGIAGYFQQQVDEDKGSDVTWGDTKDEVFAVGPEVIYSIMDSGWIIQSRLLFESDAEDRTEGTFGSIVLTKIL